MQTLQDNREILKNALNAIQAARTSFPMVLANANRPLQPRPQPQNPVPIPARFNAAFSAIDALEEIISRSSTQEAFLAAQKLPPAPAVRKRKRSVTENVSSISTTKRPSVTRAEVPSTTALPTIVRSDPWPLNSKTLEDYIRHVNSQGHIRLNLWAASRDVAPRPDDSNLLKPRYLRMTLPNIFTAFLDIAEHQQGQGGYHVLLVTLFGAREQKLPHCSSEYAVFQKMSQFLTSVIQSHPEIEVPTVVDLLSSYQYLFNEPCILCDQCWSMEGDLPPVQRLWMPPPENESGSLGQWVPRHHLCAERRGH
ncbi:hypothetical protein FRC14_003079 [Serendipita sp. 396]|nr:hypothetical protein FRC14_003079 [Serendipita sp. 396]KAG8799491.1 hypothetical protein FRC16_005001 [Serendipita sp. 398]KAG8867955.1 hypothetical protein FRC20_004465 [Serendipita sp. 405]